MYRVYFRFFIVFSVIILISCTNENDLLRDYFEHRKVANVVGFSCHSARSNVELVKSFSDVHTFVAILKNEYIEKSDKILTRFLNPNYHYLGIFLDLRCGHQNVSALILEASRNNMYDETHKWLIMGHNLKESLRIIDDSAFNIATDVVIAVPSTNGYVLYDVYNLCKDHGGSLKTVLLGTWHKETGLYVTLVKHKFSRRANLQGMTLNVGVLFDHKPPNMPVEAYLLDYANKWKDNHSKFMYAILLHIAELYNFTMNVMEIDPWQKRGGNRGPVFAAFEEGIIDICANPATMIAERLDYGDIIAPVWPVRTCFLFRTILSTKLRSTQFIRPLSIRVWYAMLIIIALTAFILLTVLKKEGIHDLADLCGISILFSVGAFSQQASAIVPYGVGGRIAFLHIMFFSLLIFNYYSASVVSNRLKNTGDKMNDSLISLADSNFKIAMEPTQYINSLLQEPHMEVRYFYQNRWLKLPESTRHLPIEEGLNRVAKGGFAYHTLTESAYPYIERTFETRMICELTEVHLLRTILGLWTRQNSPFTEMLRIGFTKINNMGLRDRQLKRWSARKPRCPANMLMAEAISIQEAAPVLLFLLVGIILSLSVCAMENLIFWFWTKRLSIIDVDRKHSWSGTSGRNIS
ncbi:hypothetical protein KPH14_009456 [Odynerus spinipes]|uniref:Ionotropic receptor 75a N-terminal domain-containing protein n=1 Tax=Odynerus spinipes TaxID=1348599 RepID=A0AAD9RPF7_9HYME|nr:hypothetical protein KPH14_009456 [Odynerus spinipes]